MIRRFPLVQRMEWCLLNIALVYEGILLQPFTTRHISVNFLELICQRETEPFFSLPSLSEISLSVIALDSASSSLSLISSSFSFWFIYDKEWKTLSSVKNSSSANWYTWPKPKLSPIYGIVSDKKIYSNFSIYILWNRF